MEAIDIIYNKIFKNLPFSITGRFNLEEDLYRFYDSISESILFEHSSNFKFFLGSVLRLTDEKIWKIKSYDEIYFKSNVFIHKDYFLSFYYYALSRLKGTENIEDFNASRVLADVFAKKLNLKISLTNDDLPTCNYDVRVSLLEIFIPKSVYTDLANQQSYRIKEILIEYLDGSEKIFKRKPKAKFPRHFSFNDIRDKNKYDNLFNFLIDQKKKDIVVEKLKELFKAHYGFLFTQDFDTKDNSKYTSDDLAITCVGLTFFCFYFDAVFEYLTSVAKIDESADARVMRNLGGIAIGYDAKNQINNEQRALFCLLSDWATAVIAGQLLHDREKLREKPLGKALYDLKFTLNSKGPFDNGAGKHYKHVQTLIQYAQSKSIALETVWNGIKNDILIKFDPYIKQVKELSELWANIKLHVENKDTQKTEVSLDDLDAQLENKIIVRNIPQEVIYINDARWNVGLVFIKDHIDSILNGIYKNAKNWGSRNRENELVINHCIQNEKLNIFFHVDVNTIDNFEAIKYAVPTSTTEYEKLGGIITLLNKWYYAELKFVNKSKTKTSSLHYINGVDNPKEIEIDDKNEYYKTLSQGLHYQIIFK